MHDHRFDSLTELCIFCGCSMSAVAGAKVGCYPDKTNLTAFRPYKERRDLDDELGLEDREYVKDLANVINVRNSGIEKL